MDLEKEERKRLLKEQRDTFRLIWKKFDVDGSGTLSKDELKQLVAEVLYHARAEGNKSKKAMWLTDREFERESYILLKTIDHTHEDHIDAEELASYLFPESLARRKGRIDPDARQLQRNDAAAHATAYTSDNLTGVVYYDDLREYTSTVESFRITGSKEKKDFPPAANWRRGKVGVYLFLFYFV